MIGRGDRKGRKWSESGGRDWQKRRLGMTVGGEGREWGRESGSCLGLGGWEWTGQGSGQYEKIEREISQGMVKGMRKGRGGRGQQRRYGKRE